MRALAALVFALALSLRLLAPAGFMPVQTGKGVVVGICDGRGGNTVMLEIPISDEQPASDEHGEEAQPCAFAMASAPMLGGHTPLAFSPMAQPVHELALPPPAAFSLTSARFITPPLRGPPALA